MISKEEITLWRNQANTTNATINYDGIRLLIALNALEQAEKERDALARELLKMYERQ